MIENPKTRKRKQKDRQTAVLRTGKRDVRPTLPSHVPGIRQGNGTGSYEKMRGHRADGTSTAERSTGINPGRRNPISPAMPNLSPA